MSENLSTREAIQKLNKIENKKGQYQKPRFERKPFQKTKRPCPFCNEKDADGNYLYIDYKDPRLKRHITEEGKILPRKQSCVCARHMRELAKTIKTAKKMGML
ncbi:MAG: 30S ribosomal protein S18 [Christensenellaceae bacterium]|jgi:small subunit ribosomal protein S18|nr:30S ribosomal protein S18 [Christensenellaceae bacterium]